MGNEHSLANENDVTDVTNVGKSNMKITHLSWGKIVVGGKIFKDIKVWPNTVKEWNWNETGTRHTPGIQIADFREFIDQVDYVILSNGLDNKLCVTDVAKTYILGMGKQLVVANTKDAVEEYNRLVDQGIKVGGLFHSTC